MKLTRPSYEVWIQPVTDLETPDHVVQVTTGDQMRAELEARRLQLPPSQEAPMNATALWIWAAMAREGLTQVKAGPFLASELGEFQPVKDAGGEPVLEAVDPTTAEPSGSA